MLFTSTLKWLGNLFLVVCILFTVAFLAYDIGFTSGKQHGKDVTMERALEKGLAGYDYASGEYYWISYEL